MKTTCVYMRALGLAALLGMLFTTSLEAQNLNEVLIMVNGPWAYVADPSAVADKILLVSPKPGSSHHHPPIVFSGPNAAAVSPTNPFTLSLGASALSFTYDRANCKATHHTSSEAAANPYAEDMTDKEVSDLIQRIAEGGGYSISLPKPCYYSTLATSRSKIDIAPIYTNTSEEAYTTWMVLHYWINHGDAASISTPGAGTQSYSFTAAVYYPHPALSIEVWSNDPEDLECDTHSLASFQESAALLGKQGRLHARFPIVLGTVQSSSYSETGNCNNVVWLTNREQQLKAIPKLLCDIEVVRNYARSPDQKQKAREAIKDVRLTLDKLWVSVPESVTEDLKRAEALSTQAASNLNIEAERHKCCVTTPDYDLSLLAITEDYINESVGHGDCRSAQFNMNGAVR